MCVQGLLDEAVPWYALEIEPIYYIIVGASLVAGLSAVYIIFDAAKGRVAAEIDPLVASMCRSQAQAVPTR